MKMEYWHWNVITQSEDSFNHNLSLIPLYISNHIKTDTVINNVYIFTIHFYLAIENQDILELGLNVKYMLLLIDY